MNAKERDIMTKIVKSIIGLRLTCSLLLIGAIVIGFAPVSHAGEGTRGATNPLVLSDHQMDRVTAGDAFSLVDANAFALGNQFGQTTTNTEALTVADQWSKRTRGRGRATAVSDNLATSDVATQSYAAGAAGGAFASLAGSSFALGSLSVTSVEALSAAIGTTGTNGAGGAVTIIAVSY